MFQEHAHQQHIPQLGSLQERSGPDPVQDVARAVIRLASHARVGIGAALQQLLRQLQAAQVAGRHRRRQPVLDRGTARPRQLMERRPSLRLGIRVHVRMQLTGQPAKRLLDLRVAGAPVNAEDVVVIPFHLS